MSDDRPLVLLSYPSEVGLNLNPFSNINQLSFCLYVATSSIPETNKLVKLLILEKLDVTTQPAFFLHCAVSNFDKAAFIFFQLEVADQAEKTVSYIDVIYILSTYKAVMLNM